MSGASHRIMSNFMMILITPANAPGLFLHCVVMATYHRGNHISPMIDNTPFLVTKKFFSALLTSAYTIGCCLHKKKSYVPNDLSTSSTAVCGIRCLRSNFLTYPLIITCHNIFLLLIFRRSSHHYSCVIK